jgi:hypothetical protein
MLKRFSMFLAASALVTLAACGGDEGPNWVDEVDSETAAEMGSQAAEVATSIATSIVSMSNAVQPPFELVAGTETPNAAERAIAMARRSVYSRGMDYKYMMNSSSPFRVGTVCVPVYSGELDEFGEPIDSDEDGVADDATISFPANCTEVEGEDTYTYSGSIRIRDLTGLWAYRVDFNNLRLRVSNTGGSFEQMTIDGFETATFASNGVTHQVDITESASFSYNEISAARIHAAPPQASAAVTGSFSDTYKENSTYDPDGTIVFGDDVPSGTLDFTLDLRFVYAASNGEESESGAIRFTMATTDPLDIDAVTCNGPVDGTIVGDLNGNEDVGFTIDWSACDNYTVTVRGTTDVVTTAAR